LTQRAKSSGLLPSMGTIGGQRDLLGIWRSSTIGSDATVRWLAHPC